MSFCQRVKNELVSIRPSYCCRPSFLYGLMLFGRSFSFKKICIQTQNKNVAENYCDMIKSVYGINTDISCGGKVIPTYRVEIESEADRLKILASVDFQIDENFINIADFYRDCCISSFIRGVFIACGNINDPLKEYRVEFNVKNEKLADELSNLLLKYGILMKKSKRTSNFQLYTKNSETIEDLMTLMGAGKIALEVIDMKVEKSFNNNINRARNCDDANISKTVEASIKQRTAIEYLESIDMLYSLPQELISAAILRKNNPEATLKELCLKSEEPLTVSGLNHRLAKIISIYKELVKN